MRQAIELTIDADEVHALHKGKRVHFRLGEHEVSLRFADIIDHPREVSLYRNAKSMSRDFATTRVADLNGTAPVPASEIPHRAVGRRRVFTAQQRRLILSECDTNGFSATVRKYSLSTGTLSRWRKETKADGKPASAKAVHGRRYTDTDRKLILADFKRLGLRGTLMKYGISPDTLRKWRKMA